MANRMIICGYECGIPNAGSIVGSAISLYSTGPHSGTYSLRVQAVSGSRGYHTSIIPASGATSLFYRIYLKLVTLPSVARWVLGESSSGITTSDYGLRLNTDGSISHLKNDGTNLIGTTAALSLNTWYRLEVGIDARTDARAFKLNGTFQGAGWTAITAISFVPTTMSLGAVDTGASTGEWLIDDLAMDWLEWPGYGKIAKQGVASVSTDNANWTLVGAGTKIAAINDDFASPDDDSGYILSPMSTTDEIIFALDTSPLPSGAVPKAVVAYARHKRDAASNSTFKIKAYVRSRGTPSSLNTTIFVSTSTYDVDVYGIAQQGGNLTASVSTYADQWREDDFSDFKISLTSFSASSQSRVTAFAIEVEYDDRSGVVYDPSALQFIASFDGEIRDENQTTSSTSSGTVAVSATHVHGNSTGALRSNPANGASGHWTVTMNNLIGSSSDKGGSAAGWVWVVTRHSSGDAELCAVTAGFGTAILSVYMDSSGGVALRTSVDGVGSYSAANTIPTGQWVRVEMEWIIPTVATSAADGLFKCWIDGSLIINSTTHHVGSISASFGVRLGTSINVTGGWDVYYDDWAGGYGWSRGGGSSARVVCLRPTAVAVAGTGWTNVGGAGNNALAMADVVADDDTTYVVTPLSTTDIETYTLSDLPAAAAQVFACFLMMRTKRDNVTNVGFNLGLITDGGHELASTSATNAWANVTTNSGRIRANSVWRGQLSVSAINASTLELQAQSASQQARFTKAQVTILYSEAAAPADPDAVTAHPFSFSIPVAM